MFWLCILTPPPRKTKIFSTAKKHWIPQVIPNLMVCKWCILSFIFQGGPGCNFLSSMFVFGHVMHIKGIQRVWYAETLFFVQLVASSPYPKETLFQDPCSSFLTWQNKGGFAILDGHGGFYSCFCLMQELIALFSRNKFVLLSRTYETSRTLLVGDRW